MHTSTPLSVTVFKTFGQHGYQALRNSEWWPLKYDQYCYGLEHWDNKAFRWCSKNAFLSFPLPQNTLDKIPLTFMLGHPDIQTNPVTVHYGGKGGVRQDILVTDHSPQTVELPVTQDHILTVKIPHTSEQKDFFVVAFDVSRTWIPKEWDVNNDSRELGIAVFIPEL